MSNPPRRHLLALNWLQVSVLASAVVVLAACRSPFLGRMGATSSTTFPSPYSFPNEVRFLWSWPRDSARTGTITTYKSGVGTEQYKYPSLLFTAPIVDQPLAHEMKARLEDSGFRTTRPNLKDWNTNSKHYNRDGLIDMAVVLRGYGAVELMDYRDHPMSETH